LHERDVVHRDLSPSNVRCVTDGRYVIIDPGYARHLARSTITVFGQPGTPGYLSPEHLSQDGPVPASDIFCVGILMYRALTGDLPIPLAGGIEIYQRALRNGRAPSVALARPDLLPTSVAVVDRCLQTQPARRYLDGAELEVWKPFDSGVSSRQRPFWQAWLGSGMPRERGRGRHAHVALGNTNSRPTPARGSH
jgi:serine/threonine-protein kinase